jgi:hypothetical protein
MRDYDSALKGRLEQSRTYVIASAYGEGVHMLDDQVFYFLELYSLIVYRQVGR